MKKSSQKKNAAVDPFKGIPMRDRDPVDSDPVLAAMDLKIDALKTRMEILRVELGDLEQRVETSGLARMAWKNIQEGGASDAGQIPATAGEELARRLRGYGPGAFMATPAAIWNPGPGAENGKATPKVSAPKTAPKSPAYPSFSIWCQTFERRGGPGIVPGDVDSPLRKYAEQAYKRKLAPHNAVRQWKRMVAEDADAAERKVAEAIVAGSDRELAKKKPAVASSKLKLKTAEVKALGKQAKKKAEKAAAGERVAAYFQTLLEKAPAGDLSKPVDAVRWGEIYSPAQLGIDPVALAQSLRDFKVSPPSPMEEAPYPPRIGELFAVPGGQVTACGASVQNGRVVYALITVEKRSDWTADVFYSWADLVKAAPKDTPPEMVELAGMVIEDVSGAGGSPLVLDSVRRCIYCVVKKEEVANG